MPSDGAPLPEVIQIGDDIKVGDKIGAIGPANLTSSSEPGAAARRKEPE